MSDWTSWKETHEKKYLLSNGDPMPTFLRYWLEYNGRTEGKTCATCAKLTFEKKKGSICLAQYRKLWDKTYPACGHYEAANQKGEAEKK